jgi:hypothetical protein
VNSFVIATALVTIGLLVAFVALRWRREQPADLGEVSSQWIVEHRAAAGHDSSRWNQR